MKKGVYKNIGEENLKQLKKSVDGIKLVPFEENHLNSDVSVFIIGEEGADLIPKIQRVSKKDPDLSILILPSNPFMINHLKASLQFSAFIGKNTKVLESINQPDLNRIIDEQSELTLTRKKFRATHVNAASRLSEGFKLDPALKSKFLDKFLAQAPVGVILLNKDHLILDVNQYAIDFLPDIENFKSQPIFSLFSNEKKKLQGFIKKNSSKKNSKKEESIEIEITDNGNNKRYVRFYHSQVNSHQNTFDILIFLDITKEKEAEGKNQEYLQNLERHNKELEQFAYIVTHDLKNPLSTISLSCEMAEEGSSEEKDHYLNIIHRSAKNLLQMLEGLEVMIDVRKDKQQHADLLEFKNVLDHVLNEYQFQIERQNIELKTDFKKKEIKYIESYLFSILHNMISNAIKYSRNGVQLKINISTEIKGKYILLKISDNGIGIDLERHKDNIFKPFRRLTQQAEGKGIGLNLIKTMIEKNGGRIEVESVPDEGTTFYCYLCPFS